MPFNANTLNRRRHIENVWRCVSPMERGLGLSASIHSATSLATCYVGCSGQGFPFARVKCAVRSTGLPSLK